MIKTAFAAWSLCLALAASAAAGGFAGDGSVARPAAWTPGPILKSFLQIGTEAIARQPELPLVNLAQAVQAGPVDEGIFARLSEQLAAQVSAEEFAAMGAEEKLRVLKIAAARAQLVADAAANGVLRDVPKRWTRKAAADLAPKLDRVAADALYQSPEKRQAVEAALKDVAAFKQAEKDAFDAWLRDTPLKIYQGAFDGAALIAKDEDGWRIGEHAPGDDAYARYIGAFGARKREIEAMPDGPWKRMAAEELVRNIADEGVARQVEEEGGDVAKLRTEAGAFVNQIGEFGYRTGDKKADAALNAYLDYDASEGRSRKPGRKQVVALLTHYDDLFRIRLNDQGSLQTRWRMMATLLKGDDESGYQPYDKLIFARSAASKQAHQDGRVGLAGYVVSMLALLIASAKHAPWPAIAALSALGLLAIAFGIRGWFLKDSLDGLIAVGDLAGDELRDFRAKLEASRKAADAAKGNKA